MTLVRMYICPLLAAPLRVGLSHGQSLYRRHRTVCKWSSSAALACPLVPRAAISLGPHEHVQMSTFMSAVTLVNIPGPLVLSRLPGILCRQHLDKYRPLNNYRGCPPPAAACHIRQFQG